MGSFCSESLTSTFLLWCLKVSRSPFFTLFLSTVDRQKIEQQYNVNQNHAREKWPLWGRFLFDLNTSASFRSPHWYQLFNQRWYWCDGLQLEYHTVDYIPNRIQVNQQCTFDSNRLIISVLYLDVCQSLNEILWEPGCIKGTHPGKSCMKEMSTKKYILGWRMSWKKVSTNSKKVKKLPHIGD